MIYGSVCSGIEAASVAWYPLGWHAAFLSEIDAFPRAILQHHYMETPLHGDFTTIRAGEYEPIDLLVGGTPCQSFSVAGLRGGLDDDRGNLALKYLKLADRLRPRWVVWENVPGVLSSNGGRDFGSILGGLVELGYGFAYRVLDAQFFGVPQRRRRVFVVGYLGDWRPAAAVLFERQSLRGDSPPSREAGKGIANALTERPDRGGGNSEGQRLIVPEPARCVATREGSSQDYETTTMIAHTLRAEGFDASEDGTGRGTPIVPVGITIHGTDKTARVASFTDVAGSLRTKPPGSIENSSSTAILQPLAFSCKDHGADANEIAPTLRAMDHLESHANAGGQVAVAFYPTNRQPEFGNYQDVSPPVKVGSASGGNPPGVSNGSAVRRLTPRECERLQGFPDDYTLIPYRGKPAKDGPRYKALGNSMAVPVMRWIGERIQSVESITQRMAA